MEAPLTEFAARPRELDLLAAKFAAVALLAASPIMHFYNGDCSARLKRDASPVTDADEAAEAVIFEALAHVAPGVPIISEEAASRGEIPAPGDEFILVDPLDGTREFLARNGEFAVNIALVRRGKPVCGAICAPATGQVWFGGEAAYAVQAQTGDDLPDAAHWRRIHTRGFARDTAVALVSRSHLDEQTVLLLEAEGVSHRRSIGSALKFCLMAQGEADIYPRFGPTMDWDIAAGDAILRAAGGIVLGPDGEPLVYGAEGRDFRVAGFVAWGRRPGGRAAAAQA